MPRLIREENRCQPKYAPLQKKLDMAHQCPSMDDVHPYSLADRVEGYCWVVFPSQRNLNSIWHHASQVQMKLLLRQAKLILIYKRLIAS